MCPIMKLHLIILCSFVFATVYMLDILRILVVNISYFIVNNWEVNAGISESV